MWDGGKKKSTNERLNVGKVKAMEVVAVAVGADYDENQEHRKNEENSPRNFQSYYYCSLLSFPSLGQH